MKTYREILKPVQVVDQHTCDVCKKEIKKEVFDISNATVELKTGHSYPGGGTVRTYSIDICAHCFEDKLIPLVSEHLDLKWNEKEEDL